MEVPHFMSIVVCIRLLLFFKFSSSYNSTQTVHQQYINSTSTVHQQYINSTSIVHQQYINSTSTVHKQYTVTAQAVHHYPSMPFRSSLRCPLVVVCGDRRHRSSRGHFRQELRGASSWELRRPPSTGATAWAGPALGSTYDGATMQSALKLRCGLRRSWAQWAAPGKIWKNW